jgi:dienelactone hydrolase
MKLTFALLAGLCCFAPLALAEIKMETVEYKDGDATLKGILAYDDAIQGKRPGVLVVHEWWGLNDYIKGRAQQLAQLGYVAFAPDIYGDGAVTDDPKVAQEKSTQAKKNDWLRSRGQLGLRQLLKSDRVEPENVAAIGYCFGGSTVLELARAGANLKGVVSFHGALQTDKPARQGDVKAKVLILTGAADPLVPKEQVDAAENEFKSAGANVKVVGYPGAKHAFTNPQADKYNMPPIGYNKDADEKSWQEMKNFFADIFGAANPKQ